MTGVYTSDSEQSERVLSIFDVIKSGTTDCLKRTLKSDGTQPTYLAGHLWH